MSDNLTRVMARPTDAEPYSVFWKAVWASAVLATGFCLICISAAGSWLLWVWLFAQLGLAGALFAIITLLRNTRQDGNLRRRRGLEWWYHGAVWLAFVLGMFLPAVYIYQNTADTTPLAPRPTHRPAPTTAPTSAPLLEAPLISETPVPDDDADDDPPRTTAPTTSEEPEPTSDPPPEEPNPPVWEEPTENPSTSDPSPDDEIIQDEPVDPSPTPLPPDTGEIGDGNSVWNDPGNPDDSDDNPDDSEDASSRNGDATAQDE